MSTIISDDIGNETKAQLSCVGGNGIMITNLDHKQLLKRSELIIKIDHPDLQVLGNARVAWKDEVKNKKTEAILTKE